MQYTCDLSTLNLPLNDPGLATRRIKKSYDLILIKCTNSSSLNMKNVLPNLAAIIDRIASLNKSTRVEIKFDSTISSLLNFEITDYLATRKASCVETLDSQQLKLPVLSTEDVLTNLEFNPGAPSNIFQNKVSSTMNAPSTSASSSSLTFFNPSPPVNSPSVPPLNPAQSAYHLLISANYEIGVVVANMTQIMKAQLDFANKLPPEIGDALKASIQQSLQNCQNLATVIQPFLEVAGSLQSETSHQATSYGR